MLRSSLSNGAREPGHKQDISNSGEPPLSEIETSKTPLLDTLGGPDDLRQLPEKEKKKYKVTDKEMGL